MKTSSISATGSGFETGVDRRAAIEASRFIFAALGKTDRAQRPA